MIKLIFASGPNGEFGSVSGMPWARHAEDMEEFRRLTEGNVIVMGSKTFESLNGKPLKNRLNVIMTSKVGHIGIDYHTDGKTIFANIPDNAFGTFLKKIDDGEPERDVYVIGGAELLRLALPYADMVHHTVIREVNEEATVKLLYGGFFEDLWNTSNFVKMQEKPSKDLKATFNMYVKTIKGNY